MKKDVYFKIIIFLAIFNFLIRLPFLNLPVNWDEINYFDGVWAIYKNNLNPFTEFWGYKPPFLFETTAILFKLFSSSREWGRLVIYILSSLAILFNYLLGKKLFNKEVGLYSSLILFCFPLFITQSFLFQDALPLLAFTLASLYFYFSGRNLAYFISASFLVLTKETAIFVILFLVLFDLHRHFEEIESRLLLKRIILLISPSLFLIIWMFLNKRFLGWYLWPYNVSLFSAGGIDDILKFNKLTSAFADIFQIQFLWFIFSIILGGLVFSFGNLKIRKQLLKPAVIFFLILFLFYFLFYLWGSLLTRYLLFVYPLIFIICCWFIDKLFEEKRNKVILTVIICLGFISTNLYYTFKAPSFFWSGERDFSLFASIAIRKEALEYIENNYKEVTVIADWPISRLWEDPFFGYVQNYNRSVDLDYALKNWQTLKSPLLFVSYETDGRQSKLFTDKQVLVKEIKIDFLPDNKDKINIFKVE